jgi:hypothetical protein
MASQFQTTMNKAHHVMSVGVAVLVCPFHPLFKKLRLHTVKAKNKANRSFSLRSADLIMLLNFPSL